MKGVAGQTFLPDRALPMLQENEFNLWLEILFFFDKMCVLSLTIF